MSKCCSRFFFIYFVKWLTFLASWVIPGVEWNESNCLVRNRNTPPYFYIFYKFKCCSHCPFAFQTANFASTLCHLACKASLSGSLEQCGYWSLVDKNRFSWSRTLFYTKVRWTYPCHILIMKTILVIFHWVGRKCVK